MTRGLLAAALLLASGALWILLRQDRPSASPSRTRERLESDRGSERSAPRPGAGQPDPPAGPLEPGAAAIEQRLQGLVSAEELPGDWPAVLDGIASPVTPESAVLLRRLALRRSDPEVAQQVIRALERGGGVEAVRALYDIGIRTDLTADAAARLSRVRGRDAAPALYDIVRDPEAPEEFVAAALRALGHTRLRAAVSEVMAIAADRRRAELIRVAAAYALGWIADPEALPVLIALLESPRLPLRRQAIRSIGRIRAPPAIRALSELAETGGNEQERLMAREALARLRGEPVFR